MLVTALIDARRSIGMSQSALAARLGVAPLRIKRLERGVGSVATLIAAMAAVNFRLTGIAPGKDLAAQLRACRLRRGLTVVEVAARTKMSRTTVASLESGGGSVASLRRLMAVVAPKARRRAQERAYWGEGDKADRDVRFTPPDFLAKVEDAFGPINLDPCGHRLSPVVATRRILLEDGDDGFVDDWSGQLAFVNPPFSEMLRWLMRAHDQWSCGNVRSVVCLVPARTDARWFHETLSVEADIFFLQGRVRFSDIRGKSQHTPFALMLVALGTSPEQRARWSAVAEGFWLNPSRETTSLPDRPVVDGDPVSQIDAALDQFAQARVGTGDAVFDVQRLETEMDDLTRGEAEAAPHMGLR
ncbi:DNA N-6-adenine-methyltransferase [Sphingomonas aracearum]|uniref:Helix-turn-helix domain-containing protein n=1 Tax=Sphingomonas aracearum TaxID=2283317 RepID=A0A369VVI8_9SPHN|nr:DNA N-6-adenine-methyltransferase [Sphingomonas aracearum]RDE06404.1 helix-turn-helix domain-containing protein [Sphingomonas aracearum]